MRQPPEATPPLLIIVALSDEFADVWTTLAASAGLRLEIADSPAGFYRYGSAVRIVAGGGREERLVDALRQVDGALEVAAVGARTSHRIAAAAVRAGAADYFAVPEDLDLLRAWIGERAERLRDADTHDPALRDGADVLPFPAPLNEIVRAAVVRTLERCGGNKSEAARQLQISRPRLLRLLAGDTSLVDERGPDVTLE